jgi:SAM-dependent methyltransferase
MTVFAGATCSTDEEDAPAIRPAPPSEDIRSKPHPVANGGMLAIDSVRDEQAAFRISRRPPSNGPKRSTPITNATLSQWISTLDADLSDKTRLFVRNVRRSPARDGFCRYLMEGVAGIYASCGINREVLRHLFPYDSFDGLAGVEFGFGNAEVLRTLAGMGACVIGLDLNPFFVQEGRRDGLDVRMARVDVDPARFGSESEIGDGSQDFAIATLLLDRLEKPQNALTNLLAVLKDGGRFAIQTLLPIVGIDDGEVDEPIVYTPESERITPGTNVEQDRLALISLLHNYGARVVKTYQLPYIVSSLDGLQEYTLWSFTGYKETAQAIALDFLAGLQQAV